MTISILQKSESIAYAVQELTLFLSEYTTADIQLCEGGDGTVVLWIDETMPAHHYTVQGDGKTLRICGGNASSVLCGVYDALSCGGLLFLATGYSTPKGFSLENFLSARLTAKSCFRLRGIRQHINFPMDISSYPLKEAQEYIRAIARMRYNAITFHTYPGQWHETRPDDASDHAGHFFYGQVHSIPKDEPLLASRIHNRKVYCIPEAEAIFEDEAARAAYAKDWLNQVMATAKEVGLTVTLSLEILNDDEAATVRMLRTVCETYPLIDTLELITEECGGFRDQPGVTRENVKDFIVGLFGEDILDADGSLPGLPEELPGQLGSSAVSLKRVLRALELRDEWTVGLAKIPDLRAGLYLTCPDTLRVLRPILRKKRPADTTMSLLPAHGAQAVVRNIADTGTVAEDWQNTMHYSWAEFDGNMFLQQLSTDGIESLMKMQEADSAYGFCINHWRTAENDLTIAYAAEAGITRASAASFYKDFARRLGIEDLEGFRDACTRLAWLDTYNRDNLFNIGFCAVNCWLAWCTRKGGIKPLNNYSKEHLLRSIEEYEALIGGIARVLPSATTHESISFLRLLSNRCRTSIYHLRAIMTLSELETIYDYDDPKPLTVEQMERAHAILDKSMGNARAYLDLYGEILPDRGGEGQLISYYVTTVAFIHAVAATFRDEKIQQDAQYDAPPLPDANVK